MARGWESKSVEAQQQDATASRAKAPAAMTPAQRLAAERRRTLQLARTRTAADLEASTSPAHRAMLEQALRALDEQLRKTEV